MCKLCDIDDHVMTAICGMLYAPGVTDSELMDAMKQISTKDLSAKILSSSGRFVSPWGVIGAWRRIGLSYDRRKTGNATRLSPTKTNLKLIRKIFRQHQKPQNS